MNLIKDYFKKKYLKKYIIDGHIPFDSINAARFLYFQNLLNLTSSLDGHVVECGVGNTRSFIMLALWLKHNSDSRFLWGYDSFEGFPEPSDEDCSERNAKAGEYAVSYSNVNTLLNRYIDDESYVRSRITLVKGFFENTLVNASAMSKISLLHLDVDLYDSYKTCLRELFPLVQKGGIITFDEYIREGNNYPGAVRAINEFFGDETKNFIKDSYYGKYYYIKK